MEVSRKDSFELSGTHVGICLVLFSSYSLDLLDDGYVAVIASFGSGNAVTSLAGGRRYDRANDRHHQLLSNTLEHNIVCASCVSRLYLVYILSFWISFYLSSPFRKHSLTITGS